MIIKYNPTKETELTCIESQENPKGFDIVKKRQPGGFNHIVRFYDEGENLFAEFPLTTKLVYLRVGQLEKLFQIATCKTCYECYARILEDWHRRIVYMPPHNGSSICQSGSIASGGKYSHCTCDLCF